MDIYNLNKGKSEVLSFYIYWEWKGHFKFHKVGFSPGKFMNYDIFWNLINFLYKSTIILV